MMRLAPGLSTSDSLWVSWMDWVSAVCELSRHALLSVSADGHRASNMRSQSPHIAVSAHRSFGPEFGLVCE